MFCAHNTTSSDSSELAVRMVLHRSQRRFLRDFPCFMQETQLHCRFPFYAETESKGDTETTFCNT
jgi:hypothetical protein